jgi:hypothetical protein
MSGSQGRVVHLTSFRRAILRVSQVLADYIEVYLQPRIHAAPQGPQIAQPTQVADFANRVSKEAEIT